VSYSQFRGSAATSETTYEYDDAGLLVRSVTVSEPDWTEADRGLVLALLEERAGACGSCGHPLSECRDPKTAGTWEVIEDICQPSRVAQAVSEDLSASKRRGIVLMTRRT
jgi:hypothetical protein